MRVKLIHKPLSAAQAAWATTVVNADTGELVEGVTSVKFEHVAGMGPILKLEIMSPIVEIESDESTVVYLDK